MRMSAPDGQRMERSPALWAQAYYGSPTFTLRRPATLRQKSDLYSRSPTSGKVGNAAARNEERPLAVTMIPNRSDALHGTGT